MFPWLVPHGGQVNDPGKTLARLCQLDTFTFNFSADSQARLGMSGSTMYCMSAQQTASVFPHLVNTKQLPVIDSSAAETEEILAQEVQQHFPHIVHPIKNIGMSRNTSEVYGVKYLELITPLLVSIQELCRQYAPLISAVKEMKLLQHRVDQIHLADGLAFVDIRERWGDEYANCGPNTSKYRWSTPHRSRVSTVATPAKRCTRPMRGCCRQTRFNTLFRSTGSCMDFNTRISSVSAALLSITGSRLVLTRCGNTDAVCWADMPYMVELDIPRRACESAEKLKVNVSSWHSRARVSSTCPP